jgi:hypothetical protein
MNNIKIQQENPSSPFIIIIIENIQFFLFFLRFLNYIYIIYTYDDDYIHFKII